MCSSQGIVLYAHAIFQSVCDSIEIAKTLTVAIGLSLANQRGWSHIEMESDALNVINAFNSRPPIRYELGLVLGGIRYLISNIYVIFKHALRSASCSL